MSASITAAFAIRSDDKSLWSWGFDQDCSLGQGYNENAVYPNKIEQREPHLVDDTNTWKAVATSNSEVMLLTPMANYGVGVMVMANGIPTMVFPKLFVNQH